MNYIQAIQVSTSFVPSFCCLNTSLTQSFTSKFSSRNFEKSCNQKFDLNRFGKFIDFTPKIPKILSLTHRAAKFLVSSNSWRCENKQPQSSMLIEDGSVYLFSDSFRHPSLYSGNKSERPDGLITVQLLEGSFTRKIFCSKGQLRERFWSPVTRKNRLSYTKVQLLENGKRAPRPWAQILVLDAKTVFWNLQGPRMVHFNCYS